MTKNNILVRRYIIVGERRLSNYWWAIVIFLGSCGFLATGLWSYLGFSNLLTQSQSSLKEITTNYLEEPNLMIGAAIITPSLTALPFFPQGLLMSFYGSLGFLLSIYWSLLIFWNVGGGFNEFNKKDGFVRIFRWGYPGKNRKIDLSYSLKDIEAIRVELKQGIDSQRTIYLRLKGKREIPLTGIGQPLTLKEIEKQASELANFLQVSLEA
uniref:Photosystem I assembly protein Ycf4 n=1 Tax=Astrephomene gubernaculifera TaxID=47775 RepID=A0A7R6ZNC4_9CHLO|nr:photosystem I assembly protein Ycf4 [Astrephomene gubernaculifera]